MTEEVPDTTKVHRNRAHNVGTPRLQRRRRRLIGISIHTYDTRVEAFARAAELAAIERELVRRGDMAAADRATIDDHPAGLTIEAIAELAAARKTLRAKRGT